MTLTRCTVWSIALAVGCSMFNREGPDITCEDLQQGALTACRDGIIATCIEGEVRYWVCGDDGETPATEICAAEWQVPLQYRCKQSDPIHTPSTGGSGATAPSGGTSIGGTVTGGAFSGGTLSLGGAPPAGGTGGIPGMNPPPYSGVGQICGGLVAADPACNECIPWNTECCDAATACAGEPSCVTVWDCIQACSATSTELPCWNLCKQSPAYATAYKWGAVANCLDLRCSCATNGPP